MNKNEPKGASTMREITYTKQGDYLIPNITLPKQPELPLGRYAMMRRRFLEQHRQATYMTLLTTCTLNRHLYDIEQTALRRLEQITAQLTAQQGVTETLKERDPMQWVQRMNNIRGQAEEMILDQLIYN